MTQVWDAFLEDYDNPVIYALQLKEVLEIFWHYCQDGTRSVDAFLEKSKVDGATPAPRHQEAKT